MVWPNIEEITSAVLTQDNILDESIRSSYHCIAETKRGKIKPLYGFGGFCVAFKFINISNGKICFRIWKEEPLFDLKERLSLISRAIHDLGLPYFVHFHYLSNALKVCQDVNLPGISMDWVEGKTLDTYLRDNAYNSFLIKNLATNFMNMCQAFKRRGIAHGDLSNANILINDRHEIKLVDYDSLYVPSMADRFYQTTGGAASFQHPYRREHSSSLKASSSDDNFSQQVIYLSILATLFKPEVAEMFGKDDLLFNEPDYVEDSSFCSSRGYKAVFSINNEDVRRRLAELRAAISKPYNAIRSICDITTAPPPLIYATYCNNCGEKFMPEARFCPKCGANRNIVK